MVPLKCLSNFWGTLEMPLINCEISPTLSRSKNCFLVAGTRVNQERTFTTTDAKLYVPVVNVSTQDDIKLLKLLDLGFKKQLTGININLT